MEAGINSLEEVRRKLGDFPNEAESARLTKAAEAHRQFLAQYPYHEHPDLIDSLTPDGVYNKGGDYFFNWVEHKLKLIGHLAIGSAAYLQSARQNVDRLKALLKIAVDDSKSVSEKVDAGWEDIPWFGGDEHIAKKVIFLYNPNTVFPIFKTDHLQYFLTTLGIDYRKEAVAKYGKGYDILALGQKYELLTELLSNVKKELARDWDNHKFSYFLYSRLEPPKSGWTSAISPKKISPMHPLGLLFEPEYEQEVVYLFSILHRDLGFPYIVHIADSYPDATAIDEQKETKRIEFELYSSSFIAQNHDPTKCDYVVCWENDLGEEDIPDRKSFPTIIALKDFIQKES